MTVRLKALRHSESGACSAAMPGTVLMPNGLEAAWIVRATRFREKMIEAGLLIPARGTLADIPPPMKGPPLSDVLFEMRELDRQHL